MSKVLQLKISLNGIKPVIWRRFLVEDLITFHQLHKIIQDVMGWEDYHLYDFRLGDFYIECGSREQDFAVDSMWVGFIPKGTKTLPADKTKLNEMIRKEKEKFLYTYDFGDNWRHSITVEKILEKDDSINYPSCIIGWRACPPEDCGGISGYYRFMEIMKDKNHPQYEEMIVEWLGEDFDPEDFDIGDVNEKLNSKGSKVIGLRKLGRNELCHCGSDLKYKKCCLDEDVKKYGHAIKL